MSRHIWKWKSGISDVAFGLLKGCDGRGLQTKYSVWPALRLYAFIDAYKHTEFFVNPHIILRIKSVEKKDYPVST